MQTIPMGNVANKALRRITPKYTAALSTLELQAAACIAATPLGNVANKAARIAAKTAKTKYRVMGTAALSTLELQTAACIAATPFLAFHMANKAAENFNQINPDETPEKLYDYKKIPKEDTISSLEQYFCAKNHPLRTRNEIKDLATRLGISPEEFSQIKTSYSKKTDPDDPFHHGKSKKEAEAEIELFYHVKAYNCFYYERYYATSEGSIIIPSKSNFIITSKTPDPIRTLHELVHLQRMNFKKTKTLSPMARWWYILHEEFRADYEALKVATTKEIQKHIQYCESELKFAHYYEFELKFAHFQKAAIKYKISEIDGDQIQTNTYSLPYSYSNWINKISELLKLNAEDAYLRLVNKNPHPPYFFRIGMAKVILFCKQASKKNCFFR
jgi:hypothetical protein